MLRASMASAFPCPLRGHPANLAVQSHISPFDSISLAFQVTRGPLRADSQASPLMHRHHSTCVKELPPRQSESEKTHYHPATWAFSVIAVLMELATAKVF